jgi:uncharacterized protein YdeI (YjbR/CyaY-like superfamily)
VRNRLTEPASHFDHAVMAKKDPRVDAYIKNAAPFARPILKHLRKIVHRAGPEIQETIRWQSPHFDHKGALCFMAAFKNHCAFGFWKSRLVFEGQSRNAQAMGQFGRITSIQDLPDNETIASYVRKAAEINERGVKPTTRRQSKPKKLTVPADLKSALQKNAKAQKTFERFSYSHKKEYVDWITGAKRDETRQRRLKTAIQWLAHGKPQNWRYL